MTLQTYLSSRFAIIGNQLGWTSTDYGYMVEDVLTLLDLESESDESNQYKLQKLGEYILWKRALTDVSLDVNFSADGASYSNSNLHAQILENFKQARGLCSMWLPESETIIDSIAGTSPYSYNEDRDNYGLWG